MCQGRLLHHPVIAVSTRSTKKKKCNTANLVALQLPGCEWGRGRSIGDKSVTSNPTRFLPTSSLKERAGSVIETGIKREIDALLVSTILSRAPIDEMG